MIKGFIKSQTDNRRLFGKANVTLLMPSAKRRPKVPKSPKKSKTKVTA